MPKESKPQPPRTGDLGASIGASDSAHVNPPKQGMREKVTAAPTPVGGPSGDQIAATKFKRGTEASAIAASEAVRRDRRLLAMFCKTLGNRGDEAAAARHQTNLPIRQPLSPRRRQTLELLLDGRSEKEIAGELGISTHTVHGYVKSLYKHFEVSSRGELLAKWVQR